MSDFYYKFRHLFEDGKDNPYIYQAQRINSYIANAKPPRNLFLERDVKPLPEPPRNNGIFSQNAMNLLSNPQSVKFPSDVDRNPYQFQRSPPPQPRQDIFPPINNYKEEAYNLIKIESNIERPKRYGSQAPTPQQYTDLSMFPDRVKDTRRYNPILHVDNSPQSESNAPRYPEYQSRSRTQEPRPTQSEQPAAGLTRNYRNPQNRTGTSNAYSILSAKPSYSSPDQRNSYEPRHGTRDRDQRFSYGVQEPQQYGRKDPSQLNSYTIPEPSRHSYPNREPDYSAPYTRVGTSHHSNSASINNRQPESVNYGQDSYNQVDREPAPWDKNSKHFTAGSRIKVHMHTPMTQNRSVVTNEIQGYIHPKVSETYERPSSYAVDQERQSFKPSPRKTMAIKDNERTSYNHQLDSTIKITEKEVVVGESQAVAYPMDTHLMLRRRMVDVKVGPKGINNMSPQEKAIVASNFKVRLNQLNDMGNRLTVQEAVEKRIILSLDQERKERLRSMLEAENNYYRDESS